MLKFSSCRPNKISPSPIQESQPSSTPPSLYATAKTALENAEKERISDDERRIIEMLAPKIEETLALVTAENFEATLHESAKKGRTELSILSIDTDQIDISRTHCDWQSLVYAELMKNPQFASVTQSPGRVLVWEDPYQAWARDKGGYTPLARYGSINLTIKFFPVESKPDLLPVKALVTKKSSCHLI